MEIGGVTPLILSMALKRVVEFMPQPLISQGEA
jgi:hypothetical protein